MAGKTRKSITKRFKITRTGKILRRLSGQNHYLAKKHGDHKRKRKKWVPVSKAEAKVIKRYLKF